MCKCGRHDVASIHTGLCERCLKASRKAKANTGHGRGLCTICNTRPKGKGLLYCQVCQKVVQQNQPKNGDWWKSAVRFAVWRGYGVAFMQNGVQNGEPGKFKAEPLPQNVLTRLPKDDRTINLDRYCPGFNRDQVRKFKTAIKRAHALKGRAA